MPEARNPLDVSELRAPWRAKPSVQRGHTDICTPQPDAVNKAGRVGAARPYAQGTQRKNTSAVKRIHNQPAARTSDCACKRLQKGV